MDSVSYWSVVAVIKAVKFVLHVVLVMSLLYCGAVVFAIIEDPDIMLSTDTHNLVVSSSNDSSDVRNMSAMINIMEVKYNISKKQRESFRKDIHNLVGRPEREHEGETHDLGEEEEGPHRRDKHFILTKWFHFVVIATTTIGYGHVHPKSACGKIFYIFFSIIGITLMMTLLKSCGKILTAVNEKVYVLLKRILCRNNNNILSDQLMSVLSITAIFFIFMLLVVWHDRHIGEEIKDWTLVDTLYFWMVTFTTVGFGDVHFSLEVEIKHVYELLFYRLIGLSFSAGIIDSIHKYLKFRRNALAETSRKKFDLVKGRLIDAERSRKERRLARNMVDGKGPERFFQLLYVEEDGKIVI